MIQKGFYWWGRESVNDHNDEDGRVTHTGF